MGWYMPGMHTTGFAYMAMGSLVFWALAAAAVAAVVVWLGARSTPTAAASTPQSLLAERYARGEIDDEEYQRRLRTLGR